MSVSFSSSTNDVASDFAFGSSCTCLPHVHWAWLGSNSTWLFLCRRKSSLWRRRTTCKGTTKIKHPGQIGTVKPRKWRIFSPVKTMPFVKTAIFKALVWINLKSPFLGLCTIFHKFLIAKSTLKWFSYNLSVLFERTCNVQLTLIKHTDIWGRPLKP